MGEVDVYPVGLLSDLRRAVAWRRAGRPEWWHPLRQSARCIARRIRRREWRSLKSTFNGYLAEPVDWPPGLRRCGSGWTQGRALRDLQRRIDALPREDDRG